MAVIHHTTLSPSKLELLVSWLPAQPWYRGSAAPDLARAGGFRLDDPAGETGIEIMVVTDGPAGRDTAYLVPFAYRGRPRDGGGLIGTAEHGVLGRRWIYDGTEDPAVVAALAALVLGHAEAQAQDVSHQPEPAVTSQPLAGGPVTVTGSAAAQGRDGTELRITAAGPGAPAALNMTVHRVLTPEAAAQAAPGQVTVPWQRPHGRLARGTAATARWTAPAS